MMLRLIFFFSSAKKRVAATLYTGDDSFGSLMIFFFSCLDFQSKSEKDEISFNV